VYDSTQLTAEFAVEKNAWMAEQRRYMEADNDQKAKMVADKSAAVVCNFHSM